MNEAAALQDLVLVPGLNNTHAVFGDVAAALPAQIRALALDNPPLDRVEAIAEALLPQLPARFWLAGFSFGGYVALAMLSAAPERVLGLAMVCSSPEADTPAAVQRRLAALQDISAKTYADFVASNAPRALHPSRLADADLMARRAAMVDDYGFERYAAHVRAAAARPDRCALLQRVNSPLAITADSDQVVPAAAVHAWCQRIGIGPPQVVASCGHLLPLEQPRALATLLTRWIAAGSRPVSA